MSRFLWFIVYITRIYDDTVTPCPHQPTSSSAIADRLRCRVDLLWPKAKDWNGKTIFMDILGLYSTTVTYLTSKAIKFCEQRKIRAITAFNVTQGHRGQYQSKARMRLPISD